VEKSFYPLREGVTWHFTVTDPGSCVIVIVRVLPRQEIEVEDLVTHELRRELAWPLEEEVLRMLAEPSEEPKREVRNFVVEQEEGVQFVRRSMVEKPDRRAFVVNDDLRWGGDATWSVPRQHYVLGTMRYRRVGEEEITVSAGKFRCVKILIDEGDRGTFWLAPGVGIVRSVGAIEGLFPTRYLVIELQGFRPP
jgi:hypothetical protein